MTLSLSNMYQSQPYPMNVLSWYNMQRFTSDIKKINLKCILKQRQSLVYLSWKVTFAVAKVRHVPPFGYDHWTLLVFGVLGRFITRELKFEDKYVEPKDMGYCTNINYTIQGQYNDYVLKTFCPDPVTQHKMADKKQSLNGLKYTIFTSVVLRW